MGEPAGRMDIGEEAGTIGGRTASRGGTGEGVAVELSDIPSVRDVVRVAGDVSDMVGVVFLRAAAALGSPAVVFFDGPFGSPTGGRFPDGLRFRGFGSERLATGSEKP